MSSKKCGKDDRDLESKVNLAAAILNLIAAVLVIIDKIGNQVIGGGKPPLSTNITEKIGGVNMDGLIYTLLLISIGLSLFVIIRNLRK